MTVYVFTGPTLSPEEARVELNAVYLPPVSQGDIYRAALKKPQAIGIIDGYFERVPAVWHKEILWAMAQGIHLYGSASIGALRAAELSQFGMEGVGKIFESYRDGILEDDDEVAVVHSPKETNYLVASEAMVNIRCTLADAVDAEVISSATRAALEQIAKKLFYPERRYALILELAAKKGISEKELSTLRDWLPHGQVNQKREDALTMLRVMREQLASNSMPKRVQYTFEYTEMWDHAHRLDGELHLDSPEQAETIRLDTLLDELRLKGNEYMRAHQMAAFRFLALEEAWRQGVVINSETIHETSEIFRRERGLLKSADLQCWLEENQLTRERFIQLMEEYAMVRWVERLIEPGVATHLPDQLRMTGDYANCVARARAKQSALQAHGAENLDLKAANLAEDELFHWYFAERLGRPVVRDLENYARLVGFEDKDELRRVVLREYWYCVLIKNQGDQGL